MLRGVICSGGSCEILARMRRERSVQPSLTRSSPSAFVPGPWLAVKFSSQRCCQPGVAISLNQSGSIGALARTSTDEGVRWMT